MANEALILQLLDLLEMSCGRKTALYRLIGYRLVGTKSCLLNNILQNPFPVTQYGHANGSIYNLVSQAKSTLCEHLGCEVALILRGASCPNPFLPPPLEMQGGILRSSSASQRQLQMHTQLKWYRGDSIAQIDPAAIRQVCKTIRRLLQSQLSPELQT